MNSHKYKMTLSPKITDPPAFHFQTKSIQIIPGTVIFCGIRASTVNYKSADRSSVGERGTQYATVYKVN